MAATATRRRGLGLIPGRRRAVPGRLSSPNELTGSGVWHPPKLSTEETKSLTAAGFRIRHQDTDSLRRLIQPWQARSFAYYDLLGEIKYAAQFYARMLAPLRLYVAKKNDKGDWEEIEGNGSSADDAKAVAALDRVQDPGGNGREGLQGQYGRLMFLTGEGILLCSSDPETELEQWEMLSTDELRIQSGVIVRYKAPSLNAEEFREPNDDDWKPVDAKTVVPYRLWKRHPRYSMWADSSMQGVLDLCEELVLLTQAVRARARSRLAGSGILFLDSRISEAPDETAPDEDPAEDPFLNRFVAAMMAPIGDEGQASAIVPMLARVDVPEGMKLSEMVYHLQVIDPMQVYPETGLRIECIHRIAIGLDMPPEELEGKSDANHWTVWNIDEQTWKAHGMPIANQLIADLTGSYFRPTLKAEQVSDPKIYAIHYDPTAVINHPDRGKDAMELYDRVAIGKEALRDAKGFDTSTAPTEEERAERIGILTRDSSLAWDGIPTVKAGGLETQPGVVTSPSQAGGESGAPAEPTGAQVEGPPVEPDQPVDASVVGAAQNGNGHTERQVHRILGASDLALLRAREAAGNRLKSLTRRHHDRVALEELLHGVPAREVAATLGPERVADLKTTETVLVESASDLIKDALRLWQIDTAAIDLIATQLQTHAARTLYERVPPPLPHTFSSYVRGILEKI